MDTVRLKSPSSPDGNHSTSSEPVIDPEDHEISDDDDRNHKHRKREAQPHSFGNDIPGQPIRWQNKKRNPFEGRQMFLYNENTALERETMQKRRPVPTIPRLPSDIGPRFRVNQPFRNDPASRFDISASNGRTYLGKGRGRSAASWSQQDSRFSSLETVDFASQIPYQGPTTHPSLFGTTVTNAGGAQNASWGPYGFINGMPNRILDPLHQLGLPGVLQPAMTPLLNMGIPRQRCRDFEERGFCLRGDMCPMEHGVNRIVVEDVQSLSQFNLPVSNPSSHSLGIQAGVGSSPSINAPSNVMTASNSMHLKDVKSGLADEALGVGVSSALGAAEADVYDPDQPLWNNECSETSNVHLRLPSPNNDDERLWPIDSSAQKRPRLADDVVIEEANDDFSESVISQTATSFVWGQVGHGSKSEMRRKSNGNKAPRHLRESGINEDLDAVKASSIEGNLDGNSGMDPKMVVAQPINRLVSDSECNGGRTSQKASRTLYIHGIPQKSNRREALLSHFQKFGKVIDIYIPLNSEIAFIQYSRREEAEAALKAPDAVMGNRFIKLWWANRDRVSADGRGSYPLRLIQPFGNAVPSIVSLALGTDREQGISPVSAPAESRPPVALTTTPPLKNSSANGPKATNPVQKKLEGLDLLEELRRKQEILAQKREEFRQQLAKFEKQSIPGKKLELTSEQISIGHKPDTGNDSTNSVTPKQTKIITTRTNHEEEREPESISSEFLASPSMLQGSSLKQTSDPPITLPSRYTVGNCAITFRVLPPLPDGFADVSVLKNHFSSYGDLASVVLEDSEGRNITDEMKPSQCRSAYISFTTRASANRAYLDGKCWQGHSLHFIWLTDCQTPMSGHNTEEILNSPGFSSVEIQVEPVISGSSISNEGEPLNNIVSGAPNVTNAEFTVLEQINISAPSNIPKSLSKVSCSSPNVSCD